MTKAASKTKKKNEHDGTEKCDGCDKNFKRGELTRDSVDAALLYCDGCWPGTICPKCASKDTVGLNDGSNACNGCFYKWVKMEFRKIVRGRKKASRS